MLLDSTRGRACWVGYCTKDSGMPHYHSFRKNVSDDEVEVGAEQYMIHGSGEDNGFATLGP